MFVIKTRQMPTTEPFEYMPGADGVTYARGQALVLTDGKLAKCGATTKPTHIAVSDTLAATPASGRIPVVRVQPDMEFEARATANIAANLVGQKVTIGADSLTVTATTTGGVFTITATDGGTNVRGIFN